MVLNCFIQDSPAGVGQGEVDNRKIFGVIEEIKFRSTLYATIIPYPIGSSFFPD